MDRYVDPLTGLVTAVEQDEEAGLPVAKASMRLRETAYAEPGWGRGDSYRGSALTAVLEAVERWGGVEPGGKRTVVHGCFADAIDPASLGLYPASRFELPDFPFDRYHETVPCRWGWGHSFSVGQPVQVPEAYAYFGAHLRRREPRFVDETSNGCALGSCPEEAILHGLLEVAERDAFLMTWYARMPVPRIHLSTGSLALLTARIEDATGWRISLFDTTLEERVPCVWALAVNPADDPRQAKAVCAGGSGLLPHRRSAQHCTSSDRSSPASSARTRTTPTGSGGWSTTRSRSAGWPTTRSSTPARRGRPVRLPAHRPAGPYRGGDGRGEFAPAVGRPP
jgi:ribosomal protein S12 methylthiotransferase accessory factor